MELNKDLVLYALRHALHNCRLESEDFKKLGFTNQAEFDIALQEQMDFFKQNGLIFLTPDRIL